MSAHWKFAAVQSKLPRVPKLPWSLLIALNPLFWTLDGTEPKQPSCLSWAVELLAFIGHWWKVFQQWLSAIDLSLEETTGKCNPTDRTGGLNQKKRRASKPKRRNKQWENTNWNRTKGMYFRHTSILHLNLRASRGEQRVCTRDRRWWKGECRADLSLSSCQDRSSRFFLSAVATFMVCICCA